MVLVSNQLNSLRGFDGKLNRPFDEPPINMFVGCLPTSYNQISSILNVRPQDSNIFSDFILTHSRPMGSAQYGEGKSEISSLYVPKSVHSIVDCIEGGGVYEMKFERRVLFPWLPHLVKHVLHTYARTCKQLLTISFTHIIFKQCVVTYQIVPDACKYSLLIINHRQEESILTKDLA